MAFLKFNKSELVNLSYSLGREIILASKTGACCNTSIVTCNTRRYHGLLAVPVANFGGYRYMMLSSLDESLTLRGKRFNLGIHCYGDIYEPRGHKYVVDFSADRVPQITYKVGDIVFRKSLLLIPVLILFLVAFTLGMGLILSTLHVFFRDMQFLWSVLVTIWNFATPIFYPDTIISPSFQKLFRLNPLYHICSFSRMIILHGASPVPSNYLSCLVSSFIVLAIGLYVFRKSQDKFILYL
jgi:hypothetical protein